MAPKTSPAAARLLLGRLWQDEVEPGAFLGLGGEEQATQGILKPKGFFRSPAEKRCFFRAGSRTGCTVHPPALVPAAWRSVTWAKKITLQVTLK